MQPPVQQAPAHVASVRWHVQLLGGMSLSNGSQTFTQFGGRSVAALLARLALQPRRSHAREELIELLWPGVDVDVGRNRLRQALFALRQFVEPPGTVAAPVLVADRSSVRVVDGAMACDAIEFENAFREGRHEDAAALYRGDLLPGHYDEWIDEERLRLAALHDRLSERLQNKIHPAVASPIATAPPRLATHQLLLPAYLTPMFGSAAPLESLRRCVVEHRLVTLMGPGGCGKTRMAVELAHHLRAQPDEFELVAFIPLVACHTTAQILEALVASLRLQAEACTELETVCDALAGRRVLVVLDNLEQCVEAAQAPVGQLLAMLPQLHLLLTSRRVLALDGEREFTLEPLALPALDQGLASAAASPAVALFIDRARAVRADFHLSERNEAVLVALAHELEGLPLAIELAASRVRSFSPQDMLERLRRAREFDAASTSTVSTATPRLDLLARTGPRAGLDPRHSSMHRVIEWSWSLLATDEARMLAALTVFPGGFTAAAAQHLCTGEAQGDDAALLIDKLMSHSLLKSQTTDDDGPMRFGFYEPIREFASARAALDGEPAAAQRRAGLRAWAQAWADSLPPTAPLNQVRLEMPNVQSALANALLDDAPHIGVGILLTLGRVLQDVELSAAGLCDAAMCVERCVDPMLRARGHALIGPLLHHGGQREAATRHAEAALVACSADLSPSRSDGHDDSDNVAAGPAHDGSRGRDLAFVRVLALLASARVRWRGLRNAADVLPLLDEAQDLIERNAIADPQIRSALLVQRAAVHAHHHRDLKMAQALYEQALEYQQACGNQHAVHGGLYNLAVCAQDAGHHDVALEQLERLIASLDSHDDRRRLAQALNVRGNALSELRRWPAAVASFRDSLREAWAAMALYEVAFVLWNMPRALAHVREPVNAVRLAAFAAQFWTMRFGTLTKADEFDLRRLRRLASRQLDARTIQREWQQGALLDVGAAVALALAEAEPAPDVNR